MHRIIIQVHLYSSTTQCPGLGWGGGGLGGGAWVARCQIKDSILWFTPLFCHSSPVRTAILPLIDRLCSVTAPWPLLESRLQLSGVLAPPSPPPLNWTLQLFPGTTVNSWWTNDHSKQHISLFQSRELLWGGGFFGYSFLRFFFVWFFSSSLPNNPPSPPTPPPPPLFSSS